MSRIQERADTYLHTYMQGAKGCTIIDAGVNTEGFPFIVLRGPDTNDILCEISRDPEGNGPGFLFGLPQHEEEE